GTLMFQQKFFVPKNSDYELVNQEQTWYHMNRASCLCAEKFPNDDNFRMGVLETLGNVTTPSELSMEIWLGTACDNPTQRTGTSPTCQAAGAGVTHYNEIALRNGILFNFPVDRFIEPNQTGCVPGTGTGNAVYDLVVNGGNLDVAGSQAYGFDTQAPTAPTNVVASGSENAIQINFTP